MRYAGVDEVGLGALAGPILTVAVAIDCDLPLAHLREWWPLRDVRDSKKTTEPQREALMPRLLQFLAERGASIGVGEISVEYINQHGYADALLQSRLVAVHAVLTEDPVDVVVIDGSTLVRGLSVEQIAVPRADSTYWIVAAASIVAKTWRDRTMCALAATYPLYQFEKNKGYGTPPHIAALRAIGLSSQHRTLPCQTVLAHR